MRANKGIMGARFSRTKTPGMQELTVKINNTYFQAVVVRTPKYWHYHITSSTNLKKVKSGKLYAESRKGFYTAKSAKRVAKKHLENLIISNHPQLNLSF